jgi:hypothetical protein
MGSRGDGGGIGFTGLVAVVLGGLVIAFVLAAMFAPNELYAFLCRFETPRPELINAIP